MMHSASLRASSTGGSVQANQKMQMRGHGWTQRRPGHIQRRWGGKGKRLHEQTKQGLSWDGRLPVSVQGDNSVNNQNLKPQISEATTSCHICHSRKSNDERPHIPTLNMRRRHHRCLLASETGALGLRQLRRPSGNTAPGGSLLSDPRRARRHHLRPRFQLRLPHMVG